MNEIMNNAYRLEEKKVIVEKYFYGKIYYCPSCRTWLGADHHNMANVNFCSKCGQALDWDDV